MVMQSVIWQHVEISYTVCHRTRAHALVDMVTIYVPRYRSDEFGCIRSLGHLLRICLPFYLHIGSFCYSVWYRQVVWSSRTSKPLEGVDWSHCFVS